MPLYDRANEEPIVEPAQLQQAGQQMDTAITEQVEMSIPSGSYSIQSLNLLVDGINKVLPLFNIEPYPSFDEDIEGPLPEEFIRQLSMVSEAAMAAGLDPLPFEEAVDDRGLEMLAGRLEGYSKDKTFNNFLSEQIALLETGEEEIPEEVTASPEEAVETDALFAERMV
tara:strand:- start:192 stop:698 length:507 start_codon:yes stop_codon:yes gene_type:complete